MKNYKSKIVLAVLLSMFSVNILLPQSSPFSRYGIGELNNNGFGRNFAMGGTGIGVRSSHYLNNTNPASYSAMDTLSFFFEAGIKGKIQQLTLDGKSKTNSNIDIDYIAFGFPITRFLFNSIGMRPASNTSYHFQGTFNNDLYDYVGKGNISNLYGSFSAKLTNYLSLGANISYLFGENKNYYTQRFDNDGNISGSKMETRINDVFFDFGFQYSFDLDKDELVIGGTFSPKKGINGKSLWITGQGKTLGHDGAIIEDSIFKKSEDWKKAKLEMPWGFGVGISYVINKRVTIAADYAMKNWKDFELYTYEPVEIMNYETANANYYSAGMEWVPNEHTGVKYFERVRYRLGLHYTDDYIKYNNKQVKDYGISFGFGFPLRRTNTSINLSIDLGRKGTLEKTVTSENYGKVTVGFTMHEYWFMKNKIR